MKILLPVAILFCFSLTAQTNILVTNSEADNVLKGNYVPTTYSASTIINDKISIVSGINAAVNSDSLHSYIEKMGTFSTRNTGSDTVSLLTGIGAARRWAYDKFMSFSAINENRLLVSYLQFDQTICSMNQHRNIFAVLPGTDVNNHEVVIIEGHIDSRCDGACDVLCTAQGMEDNATGSALVLELARVMSKYTYKNTLVFMLTIGEEQGLYGANAFSQYALSSAIPVKAVFNNDVVGGIICGATSSAPSCPGLNDIDSTNVRFFSYGSVNSPYKQLARFTKLQYAEELNPIVDVPMNIHIMSGEDRIGRGGDHIPFREDGFTSMRTTSANEHGDASNAAGYTDRQHTSDDILGVDTNNDGIIDSFYVDFNYLGRNAVINGVSAAMVAIGPVAPDYAIISGSDSTFTLNITNQTQYPQYRVAVRTVSNDWDTVYLINGTNGTFTLPSNPIYHVSAASVDSSGVESLFSYETFFFESELAVEELNEPLSDYELLQNRPNPFDDATTIAVFVRNKNNYKKASIEVRDLSGKLIKELPIDLSKEMNEVLYEHGYGATGTFLYSLVVDGQVLQTKRMIFAN